MKKKSLLLTAVATLGLTAAIMAQNVPSYVPTNGLVGWWPFNGNANDESGNGNNGTVNGATLTTDRFGTGNNAYSFDGSNDEIVITHNSSFNFTQFTISCWALKDNQSLYIPGIISKVQTNNWGWYLVTNSNISDSLTFQGAISSGNYFTANSAPLTPLQWVHIVGTFSPGLQQIYVNGVLIDIGNNPGNLYNTSENIRIGFKNGDSYWGGKIDDIGIWNRVLTPQEITDLYSGCQLSVNTQPTNQTININTNAQFIVSSSDPSATYQWQTDLGIGFQNLNSVGQYSGTTNDTLTVSNVTMSNNNQPFRCIISSGSCYDTSNVAVLTVNNNVGINETNQGNLFSVFPNPAQSIINVKTDSKLIGSDYSIFDNKERVVQTGKINSENTTIELGNLSSGIYMFNVGENMKQSFKVIKE